MNTPVNVKLVKLLKEKGFDYHALYHDFADEYQYFDGSVQGRVHVSDFSEDKFPDNEKWFPVPYIYQVIMWLYDKYGIWVLVDWMTRTKPYSSGFICHLRGTTKKLNSDNFVVINNTKEKGYEVFNTPTECYEAAIEYTLKNLLK